MTTLRIPRWREPRLTWPVAAALVMLLLTFGALSGL